MATGLSASTGIIPELMKSLAVGASPWKFRAKVVATSNVSLAGLQAIDGVSVDDNDRVLTVAQTDTTKNLLWIAHAGPWERALDADQDSEITSGLTVYIARGSSAKSFWTLVTPDDPIRLGITPLSWEKRIPDTLTLLNTATVDPTPDTLLKRGPSGEGKCTSFEMSSGGELRANIGGTFVTVATVDGSRNLTFGESIDVESIQFLAGTNKNIATLVTGTATALTAAAGAASTVAISTNSSTVLTATGGNLTLAGSTAAWNAGAALTLASGGGGAGDIILSVTGSERARVKSAGIQFPNTQDATIDVASVGAGNGKNLLLDAGDVTAGGGAGGSIALTPGTGTATGNVVCVMPIAGGISGMFKLNDGTNNFLDAKATATLSTITFDRQLLLTGGTTVTLEALAELNIKADASAGGNAIVLSVSNAERVRLKTTGLEIEKATTFSVTQPQSTSGAGRHLTFTGQQGVAGTNGANIIHNVGDAGTAGSDLQGEFVIGLGKSGDLTGILRVTGGAFGDLLTFSYDDTLPASVLTIADALEATTGGYTTWRAGADATFACANGSALKLQHNLTTRIELNTTGIGFFATAPVAQQADIGALTDNSGGVANNTIEALPDPADAPASADALRDDLVANLIPALRNNYADLTEQVNAVRTVLRNYGLMA